VKHLREKAFLVETVLLSYKGEVAIANSAELVIYYSREVLCGGSPVFFGAFDERHLCLSDLTKDFIPNRPWWVVGSPEKG